MKPVATALIATVASLAILPIVGVFVVDSAPEAQTNFDASAFSVEHLQSSFDIVASSLNNLLIGIFIVFGFLVGFSKDRLSNLGMSEIVFGGAFIISQMISGYFGVLARMRFFENIQLGSMNYEMITDILRLQGVFVNISLALCIGFFILFFSTPRKNGPIESNGSGLQHENHVPGE